jgi:DNA-binding phage protein
LTIVARARRDHRFCESLLTEAINAYLEGETSVGRSVLRDLVNATIGFEKLAGGVGKPSKSLHRMLGARGNPSTENFFEIVAALQRHLRVKLHVSARAA